MVDVGIGDFGDITNVTDWMAQGTEESINSAKAAIESAKGELGVNIDFGVESVEVDGRYELQIDGNPVDATRMNEASVSLMEGDVGEYYRNMLGDETFNKITGENPQARAQMDKTSLALKANAGQILDQMRLLAPEIDPEVARDFTDRWKSEGLTDEDVNRACNLLMAPGPSFLGAAFGGGCRPGQKMVFDAMEPRSTPSRGIELAKDLQNDPQAKETVDNFNKNEAFQKLVKQVEDLRDGKRDDAGGSWKKSLTDLGASALKVLTVVGIGLFVVWLIRQHQNEINGCWYVKKDGTREKVSDYTCKSSEQTGGISSGSIGGASCKGGCNSGSNCSSCCSCSAQPDACKSGDGGQFTCVNKDFVGSLSDLAGEVADAGGDLLKKIMGILLTVLKYLAIAVLIILGIVIVFYIIKYVFQLVLGRKKKRNQQGENPPPPRPSLGVETNVGVAPKVNGGTNAGKRKIF